MSSDRQFVCLLHSAAMALRRGSGWWWCCAVRVPPPPGARAPASSRYHGDSRRLLQAAAPALDVLGDSLAVAVEAHTLQHRSQEADEERVVDRVRQRDAAKVARAVVVVESTGLTNCRAALPTGAHARVRETTGPFGWRGVVHCRHRHAVGRIGTLDAETQCRECHGTQAVVRAVITTSLVAN